MPSFISTFFNRSKASAWPTSPTDSTSSRSSKASNATVSSSSSGSTATSHYNFSTGESMYAADARAQQASGPNSTSFQNHEGLPLSTSGKPWEHGPLIPGRTEPWQKGEPRGLHRSVWTHPDPTKFDVMSHDSTSGTTGSKGYGEFVLAQYRPQKEKKKEPRKELLKKTLKTLRVIRMEGTEELKKELENGPEKGPKKEAKKEPKKEGDDEVNERETEEEAGEEEHVV